MRKLAEFGGRAFQWLRTYRSIVGVAVMAMLLSLPRLTHAISLDRFVMNPFDSTALLLAGIINNITAVIGKLMLLIIEMIIVPILGYNGFSSADIVDLGWSLVRDVVNMGVVVILIVIAMQTIVGYHKANWTQQLPKLFVGVILVNFSRTICGLFIDVSQVVMFTFVNAIIDIAAGNFAQMLGLSQFGEFSNDFIDKVNEAGTGIEAYAYLGSAYLQLALYLAIFAVLLLMALMYIWRIVMLWLLIIMSPVAFFLSGVGDMFKASGGYYGEWWKHFSGTLIMGPLLTFFLWLALAASSGSNLAVTQDFPLPEEAGEYGLALENFSLDSLLGTFLALLLLIVGMKLASSSAAAIGGPVSKYISEDMGKKIVTGAAKMPGALVNRGGGRLLDRAGGTSYGSLTGLGKGFAGAAGKEFGLKAARGASKIPVIGGLASGAIASGSAAMMKMDKKNQEEVRKKGQDAVKDMPSDQLDMLVGEAAIGGDMFKKLPVEQQKSIFAKLATDKKAQDRAKKGLGEAKYNQLMGRVIKNVDGDKDNLLDDTGKASFIATKLKHLNLIQGEDVKPTDTPDVVKKKKQDAQRKYLDDLNKDGKLTPTMARLIGDDAIKDADTMDVLNSYDYREDKDGNNVTIGGDIRAGKLMPKQREAARTGRKFIAEDFNAGWPRRAGAPAPAPATVDPATAALNVQRSVESGALSNMDPAAQDAVREALFNLPVSQVSVATRVQADEQMLNSGRSAAEVYGAPVTTPGPAQDLQRARVEQIIKKDAENVRHFSASLPTGVVANGVTKMVVDNVKTEDVEKAGGKLFNARGEEREKAKKMLEGVGNAVKAERAKLVAAGTTSGPDHDRLERLEKAHKNATRYMNLI